MRADYGAGGTSSWRSDCGGLCTFIDLFFYIYFIAPVGSIVFFLDETGYPSITAKESTLDILIVFSTLGKQFGQKS